MRKVNFGIIGLGGIGSRFAKVLGTSDQATLLAVAARDEDRARGFARKYGADRAYGSYEALAKDPDVEAVYVSLTHNFHYEAVKMLLSHGKPVICEKPMVLHGDQARELVALAREKGVALMEAMWTRCMPAVQKATEWVRTGAIGEPRMVDAAFCFRVPFQPAHRLFNPDLAGGALLDVGCYVAEFAMGILAEHPVETRALSHLCATGVDDFTALSMRFGSGALASLRCGITGAAPTDAHIIGTDGRIVVYNFYGSAKCERYDAEGKLAEAFEDAFEDGFIYQIDHFAGLVRGGKGESPLIPHKDTIACADLFDEVYAQVGLPYAKP